VQTLIQLKSKMANQEQEEIIEIVEVFVKSFLFTFKLITDLI
jgi:hypothetical protein